MELSTVNCQPKQQQTTTVTEIPVQEVENKNAVVVDLL
jgi:hypothetical protein